MTLLPAFAHSFTGLAARQSQASLLATLRYAGAYAITTRQSVQVVVDTTAPAAYQLFVRRTAAEPWQPLATRFARRRVLPRGSTLAVADGSGRPLTTPAVTFYPNGQADPVQLTLSHPDGVTTITVDEATGHVALLPAAKEAYGMAR